MLRHLDLFSGIGGFALAARMVGGYETVGFCEIEPYCQAVLRKHWPGVPIYDDVRSLSGRDTGSVDIITGGFPCQDISSAGNKVGISGEKSGLWREYARLIREIRPRFVVVENVRDLVVRGFGQVLGDLAEIGYDAEWDCIPAAAVGAPQLRDRLWLVAYPDSSGRSGVAQRHILPKAWKQPPRRRDAYGLDLAETGPWSALPEVLRVDYGLPGVMDELAALGNAIVPQVAAIFLKAIRDSLTPPAEHG